MDMQNFSELTVLVYFGPNFLLQLVNGGFDVRILCVIVQLPKPMFLLDEIQDALTDRRFGVIAAVHFRCGCIDCLHEFVPQGDPQVPRVRLVWLCLCQY